MAETTNACIDCGNAIFDPIWGEFKCLKHSRRILDPSKEVCVEFKKLTEERDFGKEEY